MESFAIIADSRISYNWAVTYHGQVSTANTENRIALIHRIAQAVHHATAAQLLIGKLS